MIACSPAPLSLVTVAWTAMISLTRFPSFKRAGDSGVYNHSPGTIASIEVANMLEALCIELSRATKATNFVLCVESVQSASLVLVVVGLLISIIDFDPCPSKPSHLLF